MKSIFNIILCSFLLLPPLWLSAIQPHPILRSFSGQIADNSIRLSWVIKGGNTCEGTKIQRSTDGLFFETIGEIGGVCGSPDFDVPYLFVDSLPLPNQKNFYRLELGTQGFSTGLEFGFFLINDFGYNVIYDPLTRVASVYFENMSNEIVTFKLFDLKGKILYDGETRDNNFKFNMSGQSSSIYLVEISFINRKIVARIPAF